MTRSKRMITTGIAAAALAALGFGVPAVAAAESVDGSFECTYSVDRSAHTITGECSGNIQDQSATGSFEGTVSPDGNGSGTFEATTPNGSVSGSFEGKFSSNGGSASGTITLDGPNGSLPCTWSGTEV